MPLKLNDEQRRACHAKLGHNLVIASAGTGKTSTIVGRIKFLLDSNIKPEEIMLVTFTNKASAEMIARVSRIFDSDIASKIRSGTFHSIAYNYLKKHKNIVLKQPKDLKILFKSIYDKYFNFSYNNESFFILKDSQRPLKSIAKNDSQKAYSYQYLYESYLLYISSMANISYSSWLENKNAQKLDFLDIYEEIFEEFNELKKMYAYADYNDLLLLYRDEMKILYSTNKIPFIEVLCDEYQDTNPLQHSIIEAINPSSLFCVGDYDQSIYAFNGSDIGIITSFTNVYKNANVFSLSKNYRSGKYILELANKAIAHNERIYPKSLEVVKIDSLHKPILKDFYDTKEQYNFVANTIKNLHSVDKINYEDIAIIYRNNLSADSLQIELRENQVPHKRKGSLGFFESKEIDFVLKICAIIANDKDLMSFIHIIGMAKGVGNSSAKDIYELLLQINPHSIKDALINPNKNISLVKNKLFVGLNNHERAKFNSIVSSNFASHPILEYPKMTKDLAIFLDKFVKLLHISKNIKQPINLIKTILDSQFFIDYKNILIKERARNKDGQIDKFYCDAISEKINEKLKILLDLSSKYGNLLGFLNALTLASNEATQGQGVNLLSIHASKGLEFKCVFIVDLMQGRFPNIKLMNRSGSIEEERRLFYVAITRAKDILYLTFSHNDSFKKMKYEKSQFLYECGLTGA